MDIHNCKQENLGNTVYLDPSPQKRKGKLFFPQKIIEHENKHTFTYVEQPLPLLFLHLNISVPFKIIYRYLVDEVLLLPSH